jgi:hypothetical protein
LASRPILCKRAATQENGKNNPNQQSALLHEATSFNQSQYISI